MNLLSIIISLQNKEPIEEFKVFTGEGHSLRKPKKK